MVGGIRPSLMAKAVKTVYLSPEVDSLDFQAFLAEIDFNLIARQPSSEELKSFWLASVQPIPEEALETIWPSLMSGEGGQNLPMPLAIVDTNPLHVTPGRLNLATALIPDLLAGYVDSGVDPQTGETR